MKNVDKPAYPVMLDGGHQPGLTKRELVAFMAMQGELSCQSAENGVWTIDRFDVLKERCFTIADAMLDEVKK